VSGRIGAPLAPDGGEVVPQVGHPPINPEEPIDDPGDPVFQVAGSADNHPARSRPVDLDPDHGIDVDRPPTGEPRLGDANQPWRMAPSIRGLENPVRCS
jgi:hypothetical protein